MLCTTVDLRKLANKGHLKREFVLKFLGFTEVTGVSALLNFFVNIA